MTARSLRSLSQKTKTSYESFLSQLRKGVELCRYYIFKEGRVFLKTSLILPAKVKSAHASLANCNSGFHKNLLLWVYQFLLTLVHWVVENPSPWVNKYHPSQLFALNQVGNIHTDCSWYKRKNTRFRGTHFQIGIFLYHFEFGILEYIVKYIV